jgi:hypothetical protein
LLWNIVDGGQRDLFRQKVSVVARSFLPVPKGRLARTFMNGESFKQRAVSGFEQSFDSYRIRLFHSGRVYWPFSFVECTLLGRPVEPA